MFRIRNKHNSFNNFYILCYLYSLLFLKIIDLQFVFLFSFQKTDPWQNPRIQVFNVLNAAVGDQVKFFMWFVKWNILEHWKILSQLTVPGHSISKGIVYKILTTKILTFNLMSIYAYRGEVPLSLSFHRNRAFRLSTQMLVRLWRNQMKQKLLWKRQWNQMCDHVLKMQLRTNMINKCHSVFGIFGFESIVTLFLSFFWVRIFCFGFEKWVQNNCLLITLKFYPNESLWQQCLLKNNFGARKQTFI